MVILTDVRGDDTICIPVLPDLDSGGLCQASDQGGFGFNPGGNPHEVCGRKFGNSTGFSEIASVSTSHYHSTVALYTSEDWPFVQQRLQRCSLTASEEINRPSQLPV